MRPPAAPKPPPRSPCPLPGHHPGPVAGLSPLRSPFWIPRKQARANLSQLPYFLGLKRLFVIQSVAVGGLAPTIDPPLSCGRHIWSPYLICTTWSSRDKIAQTLAESRPPLPRSTAIGKIWRRKSRVLTVRAARARGGYQGALQAILCTLQCCPCLDSYRGCSKYMKIKNRLYI